MFMRLMEKRVGSKVNTNRCKAWDLYGYKTRRTMSKIMREGNSSEGAKRTLALCPIILGIFKAIARFFFFGGGHFPQGAEGRKEKGRGRERKRGMNDATIMQMYCKCSRTSGPLLHR
jgi:hypothetical protein